MSTKRLSRTETLRPLSRPRLRFLSSAMSRALLAAGVLLCTVPVAAQEPPESRAQPAQRLVIEYENGFFEVLSQRFVEKVLPPHDELPEPEIPGIPAEMSLSGFWFELVVDEAVRYRRLMENPIFERFEGIDPDQTEEGLSLVESLPDRRIFTILIPYFGPQAIHELVIFSSPLEPGQGHLAASEIARLPLADPDGAPSPIQ